MKLGRQRFGVRPALYDLSIILMLGASFVPEICLPICLLAGIERAELQSSNRFFIFDRDYDGTPEARLLHRKDDEHVRSPGIASCILLFRVTFSFLLFISLL